MWQGLFQSHGNICDVERISVLCGLLAVKGRLANFLKPSAGCAQGRTQSQMCFASAKVARWTRESDRLVYRHPTLTQKPVSAGHWKALPSTANCDAHGAMPRSQRHALPFSVPRVHGSHSPLFSQVFNYTQEKKKVLFRLQNLMRQWWDALCFFPSACPFEHVQLRMHAIWYSA